MARKAAAETFDELLDALAPGEQLQAFADRAGVANRTLWRWRTGQAPRPQRGALSLVAAALKCDISRVRAAVMESSARARP